MTKSELDMIRRRHETDEIYYRDLNARRAARTPPDLPSDLTSQKHYDCAALLAYIDTMRDTTMRDTVIVECARIAKQHRPPRPPANRYVFASEELQNTIRDESRGEEIAAEEIYKAIISLKSSAHILYELDDTDAPSCIKDSNGDIVLGLCRVCNAGEIELEEPCIPKW